jgi:hypothetical protein
VHNDETFNTFFVQCCWSLGHSLLILFQGLLTPLEEAARSGAFELLELSFYCWDNACTDEVCRIYSTLSALDAWVL